MKLIFCFLFALLYSLAASAGEDPVVDRFRSSAVRAFEKAENRGISEVEGIRVADMKSVAKSIPIVYSARITLQEMNRRCAYWIARIENATEIPSGKKVTMPAHIRLNKDCKTLPDDELESLAVHEVLGVGFGVDRNYEITLKLLTEPSATPSIIDYTQNKEQTADFLVASGGSVGVGGGGDSHDLRFKSEALSYLKALDAKQVYGIPTELIALAIQRMAVAPAADLSSMIEFRAAGVERATAKSYVDSAIYRGNRPEDKTARGFLGVVLARQMILYASDELGLTNGNIFSSPRLLQTSVVQKADLFFPKDENDLIHWSNDAVSEQLTPKARKKLWFSEMEAALKIQRSEHFKSLRAFEAGSLTLRLAR